MNQLEMFPSPVNGILVRAYERIDAGLVDETGRERAEGPRMALTEAQRRNYADLTGRCQHHGAEACCTRCTSTTDGLGFPHPSEAKGRKRYQRCPVCADWVAPEVWVNDIAGARFGCVACAGSDAFPPGAVENVTLNAAERRRVKTLIGGAKPRRNKERVTGSVVRENEPAE